MTALLKFIEGPPEALNKMDLEEKLEIFKTVGEEIVTEGELKEILSSKEQPIAYDGFEPSGLAHIPFGLYRAMNLEELLKTGLRFKLLVADWYAWINNKIEGDLGKIRKVGEYFVEVWKAAGVDMNRVEVIWTSDIVGDDEYWKKVIQIAKNTTLSRAQRAVSIMGRKAGEIKETAQLFYPMMQVADIFWLEADICQLGLDQRRANILAREVGPKLGWGKPVIVSHHMLMGLEGVKQPEGYDEDQGVDIAISSKMSKSKPESCIYVHDVYDEIRGKIMKAYCPEKVLDNNPILDYCKHVILRKLKMIEVERQEKFGGKLTITSYGELERLYREGELHPLDLKNAVAYHLDKLLEPIRKHFQRNRRARELYEMVRRYEVSR